MLCKLRSGVILDLVRAKSDAKKPTTNALNIKFSGSVFLAFFEGFLKRNERAARPKSLEH